MSKGRKLNSEQQIRAFFKNVDHKVFKHTTLLEIIDENRILWNLPQTTPGIKLIERFEKYEILKRIDLHADDNKIISLYIIDDPSVFEISSSLRPKSYLTHYTAVFLHGLTTQFPKTIYVTFEQSQKPNRANSLTQSAIDRAFSQPQRRSETKIYFEDYTITLLNGMHTNRIGVIKSMNINSSYSYTNLERTLIDITVRPNYAGGAFTVLETYKKALDIDLSVNKLIATLNSIDFIYPYHQSVGFYLERAGYRGNLLNVLKRKPMLFDFYLDYHIEEKEYSKEWKVFYPKGI